MRPSSSRGTYSHTLAETDGALSAAGTVTAIDDVGDSDTFAHALGDGTIVGNGVTLTTAQMNAVAAGFAVDATGHYTFNLGSPDYLDPGQSIDATFNVHVIDQLGADTIQAIRVHIDGTLETGPAGTPADDTLTGRGFGDLITGGGGDDTIRGLGGNDLIYGDGGDDTIDGGAGDDTIHGGVGDDIVVGGSGNDIIYGEGNNDQISGGSGDDELHGGLGTTGSTAVPATIPACSKAISATTTSPYCPTGRSRSAASTSSNATRSPTSSISSLPTVR